MDDVIGAPKQQPMLETCVESQREVSCAQPQAAAPCTGEEEVCRLCFHSSNEPLIAPCHCSGTSKWVHRSCLNQWRSKGMVTNQKAMTHCPSCNFEYDIYCTADIQEDQRRRRRFRWQLLRHSLALCLLVQCFEVALALVLAVIDQGHTLRRLLRVAEETVSTEMRRWWTPFVSRDIFYYYAAAVMLSMFVLGLTSFLLLVKRSCCRRAEPDVLVHRGPQTTSTLAFTPGPCQSDCCDCDVLCWSCDCNCLPAVHDMRCCCCTECCPDSCPCDGIARGSSCESCGGETGGTILAVIGIVIVICFILFGLIVAVLLFVNMLNTTAKKYVHVLCLKDVAQRYAVVDHAAQEAVVLPMNTWQLTQGEIRQNMQTEVREVMGSLMRDPVPDAQEGAEEA